MFNPSIINSCSNDTYIVIHIVQEKLLAIGDSWCVERNENWEEKTQELIKYFENKDFDYYLPGHCKLLTKEEGISRLKNEYKEEN